MPRGGAARPRRPGTGKTELLARRVSALAGEGVGAQRVAVLVRDEAAAAAMRTRIGLLLHGPYEELAVLTYNGNLRAPAGRFDAAVDGGGFVDLATTADRLAMLLDRAGELELRHHDFRGRPLALFASIIGRIDRLKSERVDAERLAQQWARSLPDDDDGAREREFAALLASHDRMLADRGLFDRGELLFAATRLLEGAQRRAGAGTRRRALRGAAGRRLARLLRRRERELVAAIERCGVPLTRHRR